jgi:sodium-dependent dicarboxylate transporter 2/3/5
VRETVRDVFGDAIRAEVAKDLSVPGMRLGLTAQEAALESPGYQRAITKAVERRGRVMIAAAAVTALVACWWITVAIPIPVTSLLPLVLFPLVGVMTIQDAAAPYANSNVFLFMGGFMIALAIERWGLHRRIALHIVRIVGTSRATIVLGFMAASALLSMWISNTATTLMMIPIGLAIISAIGDLGHEADTKRHKNFAAALMLGIAYAASIGGVATPIGTPPNISFRGQLARLFPLAPEISFGQWMVAFLPLVLVFLPVVWVVLVRITCPVGTGRMAVGRDVIRKDLHGLGPIRGPEACVLVIFLLTAVLWMTRTIPLGDANYGWSALIERWTSAGGGRVFPFNAKYVNDATVAMGMAVLLFIIPVRSVGSGVRTTLMNWTTAQRLPWGILLLFGGGFSLAAGLRSSGMSMWCGQVFADLGVTDPLYVVGANCLMMTFLTEVTSNTATTEVMLPILAGASGAMGLNPLLLMLPATISASCAFMMPVATPPNAIVFGTGHVEMGCMVRSGLIINLIGVVLVTATFYLFVGPILEIDATSIPQWAQ